MVYRPPAPPSSASPPSPAAAVLLAPEQSSGDLDPGFSPLAPRPELRMNWTYKPKRRLLNYDADDVFESEDSSGSRSSRKTPLQPIPERSPSADSDHGKGSQDLPV